MASYYVRLPNCPIVQSPVTGGALVPVPVLYNLHHVVEVYGVGHGQQHRGHLPAAAEPILEDVAVAFGTFGLVAVEQEVAQMAVHGMAGRTVEVTFLFQRSSDEQEKQLQVAARALVEFPPQSPDLRRYSTVASETPMEGWDSERCIWATHSEELGQVACYDPSEDHSFYGPFGIDSQDQVEPGRAKAFRLRWPQPFEAVDL